MANESTRTAQWITATLSGNATLAGIATGGFWELPSPEGTVFPAIVFNLLSERDINTGAGQFRIMTDEVWCVRIIVESESFTTALPAADLIDTLLHRGSGSADGADILSCVREEGFRLIEVNAGKKFLHLGGIYRINTQKV